MKRWLRLADFFIGKPGPASLTEALVMDLPVVTECGASTLIHERYNAQWVEEHQVGVVIKNFKQVHRAVEQFLDLGTFAHYRAKAAAIENRAVFEITDLLQNLLTQHCTAEQAVTL